MSQKNNPWSVGMTMKIEDAFDSEEHITEIVDSEGAFIGCVNLPNQKHANLFAAAPDLLEALEALQGYIEGRIGDRLPIKGAKEVVEKVNAALAKAKVE